MNWREIASKIYAATAGLFLGLIATTFVPGDEWLDRPDHWQIDLHAEDATIIEEVDTDRS